MYHNSGPLTIMAYASNIPKVSRFGSGDRLIPTGSTLMAKNIFAIFLKGQHLFYK